MSVTGYVLLAVSVVCTLSHTASVTNALYLSTPEKRITDAILEIIQENAPDISDDYYEAFIHKPSKRVERLMRLG
ncbi:hypothetical protein PHET_01770 [Paragonimus heterotremus]|uniref:Uncharacterized protein n=1 Tax=Paragonimus heterotremus TaxID=100268 RepID=A0A8J4T2Z4_9TREM|nr:hypothetical protein PHET_01770 [Paragonimus heterotremus]